MSALIGTGNGEKKDITAYIRHLPRPVFNPETRIGMSALSYKARSMQESRLWTVTEACLAHRVRLQDIAGSNEYRDESDQKVLKNFSGSLRDRYAQEIEAQTSLDDLIEIRNSLGEKAPYELLDEDFQFLQNVIGKTKRNLMEQGFLHELQRCLSSLNIDIENPENEKIAAALAEGCGYDTKLLKNINDKNPNLIASYFGFCGKYGSAIKFTDELMFAFNKELKSSDRSKDSALKLKALCLSLAPMGEPGSQANADNIQQVLRFRQQLSARADFDAGILSLQDPIADLGIEQLQVRSPGELNALNHDKMIAVDNLLVAGQGPFKRLKSAAGLAILGLSYKAYRAGPEGTEGTPDRAQDCNKFIDAHENRKGLIKMMGRNNLDLVRNDEQALAISASLYKMSGAAARGGIPEAVLLSGEDYYLRASTDRQKAAICALAGLPADNDAVMRQPLDTVLQMAGGKFNAYLTGPDNNTAAYAQALNFVKGGYVEKNKEPGMVARGIDDLNAYKGRESNKGETLGASLLIMQDLLTDGIEDLNAAECERLNFDLQSYKNSPSDQKIQILLGFLTDNRTRAGQLGYDLAAVSYLKLTSPGNPKGALDDLCSRLPDGQALKEPLAKRLNRTDDQKIAALQTLNVLKIKRRS